MGNKKKIEATHTCLSTYISNDHINLNFAQIATLIAEIKNHIEYTVSYKRAWHAKQKALAMEFSDWEESYNHLPRRFKAMQNSNPGTIVKYVTHPYIVGDVQDMSIYILQRVSWSFKPCIEGFKYCKLIMQVDGTFLTRRYNGTLLTTIGQDGNHNIFPLAFAIVEGETKEAMIWLFQLLREYVTPQLNLCLITDRGTTILSALQSPEFSWEGNGLTYVYCIRHVAFNFNNLFKNAEVKTQPLNMGMYISYIAIFKYNKHYFLLPNSNDENVIGYEMKQPRLQAKISAMRAKFQQETSWINQLLLKKWTQAYDGGKYTTT